MSIGTAPLDTALCRGPRVQDLPPTLIARVPRASELGAGPFAARATGRSDLQGQ